jgi:sulfatase-modifying factor enzyme 1
MMNLKKTLMIILSLMLTVTLFTACSGDDGESETTTTPASDPITPDPYEGVDSVGEKATITVGSLTFSMIYVPRGITFPTGTDDSSEATISTAYLMGETEATNELVAAVYQWAYTNGKLSDTVTDSNGIDANTVKYGAQELLNLDSVYIQISYSAGVFSVDAGFEKYPVVEITWYGSIMFCNWLTEMIDGNTDELVYFNIDTDWLDDETVADITKKGYRLPGTDESEAASRYIGTTNPGHGMESSIPGVFWTKGNHASGATKPYNDADLDPTKGVSWYTDNNTTLPNSDFTSGKGTHPVGTAGNSAGEGTPLTGNANQLGLYDMSGNVQEWIFDESGSLRVRRGGNWHDSADLLRVGYSHNGSPNSTFSTVGFRFARTR